MVASSPHLLLLLLGASPTAFAQDGPGGRTGPPPFWTGEEVEEEDDGDPDGGDPDDGVPDIEEEAEDGTPGLVVTVVGTTPREVAAVPGSASVLTEEDLDAMVPLSTNEALQMVPGVTVLSEDGMGLRQNIGIRGLNPDRSQKVLVLEDGVPVALAPYGEPGLYYTPMVERMRRIEVVKGSGSVLFGPQTVGGVINYITHASPRELLVEADARAGTWGYWQGRGVVGDTVGAVGYRLELTHQRFGGERDLNLVRTDANARLDLDLGNEQSLMVKLQVYDESSQSTYLGLTTPQFETDPTLSMTPHDRFTLSRVGGAVRHALPIGGHAALVSTAYAHQVVRDWRRQDFDREDLGYDYERIIDGSGQDVTACQDDASCPTDGSSVFFRDSTRIRSRTFRVGGLEERLSVDGTTGPLRHAVQVGLRGHVEVIEERITESEAVEAEVGTPSSAEDRLGRAISVWAMDRVGLADDRVQVSPGLRVEALWLRNERLLDSVTDDAGVTEVVEYDQPLVAEEALVVPLPGLGVSVGVAGPLIAFAGVHRGFSPPRTKDTLTTDGSPVDLEAELAWNYEVGLRLADLSWLQAETAAFLMDFDNQVVPPTESAGAAGYDELNSGESVHSGIEASAWLDPADAAGWGIGLPVALSYTFLHTEFGEGWGAALEGQPLPYAPAHHGSATVGIELPIGASAVGGQLKGTHTGKQYTDRVATEESSIDGLLGAIPAHTVLDARVSFSHEPSGVGAFLACKNLLDEVYISSRSPRGIQPGARRHIFGGLTWRMP